MKKAAIVLLILVSAIGAAVAWMARPRTLETWTDSDSIREAASSAVVREILWKPPSLLPESINAGSDEFEPRITADGLKIFFVRGRPGGNADIFHATRGREGWGAAEPLTEINTTFDELGPSPSPDGEALYFYSDRPGGMGGYDLWVVTRRPGGWGEPKNLGAVVNTAFNEYGPSVSPDGKTLYFASNRPRPGQNQPTADAWHATIREDLYRNDYDLYSSALSDAGPLEPTALAALNSGGNEGSPSFSPVGDFLYFSSDRSGGLGGFDLYRARRVNGVFRPPENLGATVNTRFNELDPSVDAGGFGLLFSSDRTSSNQARSETGYDLYSTVSREVFREIRVEPTVIDWAGLWKRIAPNMLWAVLSLLLTLLLAALLRDVHRRRLSLMAKCLLVSILIHSILMMLFNVVEVTASIASAIRGNRSMRVKVAGTGGAELHRQIRGPIAAEALASPAQTAIQRVSLIPLVAANITPARITMEHSREAQLEALLDHVVPRESTLQPAPTDSRVTTHLPEPPTTTMDLPREVHRSDVQDREDIPIVPVASGAIARASLQIVTSQPTGLDARILPTVSANSGVGEERVVFAGNPTDSGIITASASPVTAAVALPSVSAPKTLALPSESVPQEVPTAIESDANMMAAPVPPAHQPIPVGELGLALHGSVATPSTLPIQGSSAAPSSSGLVVNNAEKDSTPESAASVTLPVASASLPNRLGAEQSPLDLPSETKSLGVVADGSGAEDLSQSIGKIVGRVIDSRTGAGLSGAALRLDVVGQEPIEVSTDESGRYVVAVPEIPEFFAFSASREGFVPKSRNVSRKSVKRRGIRLNFSLDPVDNQMIALEAQPVVHHLGNDAFEGAINSQFQRHAEGRNYTANFDVSHAQLSNATGGAEIELLAKGVQCPHKIRINGVLLDARLPESPADGSFGVVRIVLQPGLLIEGGNMLEIRAVSCRGDLDDFEFVNVRIRLATTGDESPPR